MTPTLLLGLKRLQHRYRPRQVSLVVYVSDRFTM
jgi:hypothetical protein